MISTLRTAEPYSSTNATAASSAPPAAISSVATDFARLQNLVTYPLSWSQQVDEQEDLQMARHRMGNMLQVLALYDDAIARYRAYCKQSGVDMDRTAVTTASKLRLQIDSLMDEHNQLLLANFPVGHSQRMIQIDQTYRSMLNLQVSAARLISWTAQTYLSSKVAHCFDGARKKKDAVNYDRVQSPRVNFIERQLSEVYGFDEEKVEVLVTCSGTAAYNILEKFLSIHVMKPGDNVLIVPTMYDEHQDWAFRDNPNFNLITEDIFDTGEIIKSIERTNPRVVMIDPLKNRQSARATDVTAILNHLRDTWQGEDIYFLIDDTMAAASADYFREAEGNEKLKVLLCSSGGKYLQIGQDVCMSGLVAYPKDMSKRMRNVRMFHGSILSDTAAWSYPNFDRKDYLHRMRRMTRNGLVMNEILSQNEELGTYFTPIFPGRPDHPDYQIVRGFPFIGGIVNLRLLPRVTNPKETLHDILDDMILSIIEQAQRDGSSICWGEAVGFSMPRVAVHLEWLWRLPPYLRINSGDRSLADTIAAAHSITQGLLNYVNENRDKFDFTPDAEQDEQNENIHAQLSSANLGREELGFFS